MAVPTGGTNSRRSKPLFSYGCERAILLPSRTEKDLQRRFVGSFICSSTCSRNKSSLSGARRFTASRGRGSLTFDGERKITRGEETRRRGAVKLSAFFSFVAGLTLQSASSIWFPRPLWPALRFSFFFRVYSWLSPKPSKWLFLASPDSPSMGPARFPTYFPTIQTCFGRKSTDWCVSGQRGARGGRVSCSKSSQMAGRSIEARRQLIASNVVQTPFSFLTHIHLFILPFHLLLSVTPK